MQSTIKNGKTRYTFGWEHKDDELAQGGVTHRHFASPANFAAWLKDKPFIARQLVDKTPTYDKYGYQTNRNHFNADLYRGINLLENGSAELVEQAKTIMKQLHAKLPTTQRQWQLSPVGFFPNVPGFLAGDPENMFTIKRDNSDSSPVRIWVNVLPSGGINQRNLLKRGAVLVALTQLLLERRSMVRITCYGDQPADTDTNPKGVVVSWDLPTQPMNLMQLCTSLGYPEVVRNVTLEGCKGIERGITGGWLRGHCPGYSYDEEIVRQDLGAEEEDVIIPAAFSGDDLHNDPVAFLHRELTRILGESDYY